MDSSILNQRFTGQTKESTEAGADPGDNFEKE